MHPSYTSAVMAVATSNKANPPTSVRRQRKSNLTPVSQLIAITNPDLGLRTSPNAKAFSDNKVTFKHQSRPENPHRRLWNIAESIISLIFELYAVPRPKFGGLGCFGSASFFRPKLESLGLQGVGGFLRPKFGSLRKQGELASFIKLTLQE